MNEQSRNRLALSLGAIALLLCLAGGFAARYARGHMGQDPTLDRAIRFFHINEEANLPTWYSSALLLVSALTVYAISRTEAVQEAGSRWHWRGLAFVFFFLSLDETAQIHEMLSRPARDAFNTSGALYFAWVIPYAVLLLVLTFAYLRFFLRLESRTQWFLILAAVLYIGGAMGTELFQGIWFERYGGRGWKFVLMVTVEEAAEMLGVIVFLYAMLEQLEKKKRIAGVAPL